MKRSIKVASILALAVPFAAFGGGSAFAGVAGHPITGTCYEDGSWFVSSNVRTVGGTYINANFSAAPSKGMVFEVHNYQTGAKLGYTRYVPPTTTQTLAYAPSGTQFVNAYRLQVSGHQDNYAFNGSEIY